MEIESKELRNCFSVESEKGQYSIKGGGETKV